MADFATVQDVMDGWRLLTPEEYQRAVELVAKASRTIRAEIPTVDARLAAVPPTLDAALVMDVCCDMVRRTLGVPLDQQPVSQVQQSAGIFSQSMTLANPQGDMYLTKAERRRLGGSRQVARTVDMFIAPTV